jgi:hypothetical protein
MRDRRKWLRHPNRGPKYLLRNVHPRRMDVALGDLGVRIPYGHTYDLLSPTAHLDPGAVERSRREGSVAQRLAQKVLIEVQAAVLALPPRLSVAEPAAISFPQRIKSLVVPKDGDLADSVQSVVLGVEDEELLKQMEDDEKAVAEGDSAGLPVSIDPAKASAILDKVSGGCCGGKRKK